MARRGRRPRPSAVTDCPCPIPPHHNAPERIGRPPDRPAGPAVAPRRRPIRSRRSSTTTGSCGPPSTRGSATCKLWELVAATRREVLTVAAEYTPSYRDVDRPERRRRLDRPADHHGGPPARALPSGRVAQERGPRRLCPRRSAARRSISSSIPTAACATSVGVPVGTPREARLEEVPFDAPGAGDGLGGAGDRRSRRVRLVRPAGQPTLLAPLEPQPDPAALVAAGGGAVGGVPSARARAGAGPARARGAVRLGDARAAGERTGAAADGDGVHGLAARALPAVPRGLQRRRSPATAAPTRCAAAAGRCPTSPCAPTTPAEGPWFEVPWWIWSRDDPRRRRVFANTRQPRACSPSPTWRRCGSSCRSRPTRRPRSGSTPCRGWRSIRCGCGRGRSSRRCVARLLWPTSSCTASAGRPTTSSPTRSCGGSPAAIRRGTRWCRARCGCRSSELFPELGGRDPAADLAGVHRLLRDLEFHPERHLGPDATTGRRRPQELVRRSGAGSRPTPPPRSPGGGAARSAPPTSDLQPFHTQESRQATARQSRAARRGDAGPESARIA